MPPKKAVGMGKKKSKRGKKGRGLLGSIGGALGSAAGNMLGGFVGLGKKKRGKGNSTINPYTVGLKPGFIQA